MDRALLGMPLSQALRACEARGITPRVVMTGERADAPGLTARVIALRPDTLVAALFYDGAPRRAEETP